MLHVARQPLAAGGVGDARLVAVLHVGAAVAGEGAIQEKRELVAPELEDHLGHGLLARRPAPQADLAQPQRHGVVPVPARARRLALRLGAPPEQRQHPRQVRGRRRRPPVAPAMHRARRHARPCGQRVHGEAPRRHRASQAACEPGARLAQGRALAHDTQGRRAPSAVIAAHAAHAREARAHGPLEVGAQPRVAVGERGARADHRAVRQEIGDEPHLGVRQAAPPEEGQTAGHRDVLAHAQLLEALPPLDGEKGVRRRGQDLPSEGRAHAPDRLAPVVDEGARARRHQPALRIEADQRRAAPVHARLDRLQATRLRIEHPAALDDALAHGRTPGDDDEVAGLQAAGALVEVREAGGHARDGAVALVQLVDAVDRAAQQLADVHEALARAPALLGDAEDGALGLVEQLADAAPLGLVGAPGDLGAHARELAQHRVLAHDVGVVGDVGRAGGVLGERAEVGEAACLLEQALAVEPLREGDHVEGPAGLGERRDGAEDQAVVAAVEVLLRDAVGDPVPGLVVEHEAAEHGLLGGDAVGRQPQALAAGIGQGCRLRALRHGSSGGGRTPGG